MKAPLMRKVPKVKLGGGSGARAATAFWSASTHTERRQQQLQLAYYTWKEIFPPRTCAAVGPAGWLAGWMLSPS